MRRITTLSAVAGLTIALGCSDAADPTAGLGPEDTELRASAAEAEMEDLDDTLFEFKRMVGNTATGAAGAIRGINAGGAPWVLDEAEVKLNADGTLKVEVEGLIIPFLGRNPVSEFRAVLSCLTEMDVGGTLTVVEADPIQTATFPATAQGDAEIEERLQNIPEPCLAPIVFVTHPRGAWFAVTGF